MDDLEGLEVISQADDLVDEYPDIDLTILADSLSRDPFAFDDGEIMARAVVAELRRRALAGLRTWPHP